MRRTFTIIFFLLFALTSRAESEEKIFATWEGFEADKLASIWLIRRFIAPGAKIIFYPRGQLIIEGVPFDTPQSRITRRYNRCTFESFLEHYRIKEKKLINISRLIHDIEINTWERKLFKRTREVEIAILEILDKNNKNEDIINKSSEYFDYLYSILPQELEPN